MVGKGNLVVLESSNISKTREATPTKIGVYALHINLYFHEFLSRFRSSEFFDDHGPCPKREIWPFLKGSHISETRGVMPTKTGVHARDIDP